MSSPASSGRKLARILGWSVLVLVVALVAYACLGWVALWQMYEKYGGSGHPPAPSAPSEVYITVFLVGLPILSLAIGLGCLWLVRLVSKAINPERRL